MIRQKLAGTISAALKKANSTSQILSENLPDVIIGIPANETHGDFSCNIAMQLAKGERKSPRQVADIIISNIEDNDKLIGRTDVAGPGFINFFMAPAAWQNTLSQIEAAGDLYGRSNTGKGRKIQVEFVSANPTGPLHIGHGRGAAIGDVICRLFEATGWDVTREFYYNDAGAQISNLALSVQSRCRGIEPSDPSWPADGYQGEYIREVAQAYLAGESVKSDDIEITATGDPDDLDAIRRFSEIGRAHV